MCRRAAILLLLLAATLAAPQNLPRSPSHLRGMPTVNELIEGAGYKCTNLLVKTEDGYYIWLHRIGNNTGTPVMLQHGFLNGADIWLTRGGNTDFAYMLMKEGYDVYLSNFRGNYFTASHEKYKRSDPEFWDFSFDEHGYYDLPAMVDRVLEVSGKNQLIYVGHSLGTTAFLVMASSRPEYNEKIKVGVLLAPVPFLSDQSKFSKTAKTILNNVTPILRFLNVTKIYELMPRTEALVQLVKVMCNSRSPMMNFCLDLYGTALGEYRQNIDKKTFVTHVLAGLSGTSLKSITHGTQLLRTSNLAKYDYGREENLRIYNSSSPPVYPLEKITAPVALFWSKNDIFSTEKSIEKLKATLPNVVLEKVNSDPKFTHSQVFIGLDAKETLYDEIIEFLNKYKH